MFPNARNSDAELAPLGLTDAEAAFASMSPAGSRLALVRSGDASAIVDLDLSALGPLLGALAGSDGSKAEWHDDTPEWKEAG